MVHMHAYKISVNLSNALFKRSSLVSNSPCAHSILKHYQIHISLTIFQIFGGGGVSPLLPDLNVYFLHLALHVNVAFKRFEAILNL